MHQLYKNCKQAFLVGRLRHSQRFFCKLFSFFSKKIAERRNVVNSFGKNMNELLLMTKGCNDFIRTGVATSDFFLSTFFTVLLVPLYT